MYKNKERFSRLAFRKRLGSQRHRVKNEKQEQNKANKMKGTKMCVEVEINYPKVWDQNQQKKPLPI